MEKQKMVVVLLVVAILFSVVSTVMTLSLMNFKPTMNQPQPKVVYSGQPIQGNPNGGVSVYVVPQPSGVAP